MKTNAINLKRGDFIFFRNEIWQIIKTIFSFQGRGMANIKFKIKSIKSGKNIDVTLKSNEQLDTVDVTLEKMQYLYSDKDTLFFMNKTYNQFFVSKKMFIVKKVEIIKDFNIDAENSWMIGDSEVDIIAAEQAGVNSIYIFSDAAHGKKEDADCFSVKPDLVKRDILDAIDFILGDQR